MKDSMTATREEKSSIIVYNSPMQSREKAINSSKKVALGMSGGVDSSLSAYLLKEQGYEVTGVYLECWRAPGCRTEEDRKDALKVALEIGIPFQVLDFKQAYKDRVVEYFFQEYEAGRTPNPDVMCNKEIKFGLFYDWAIEHGFDYVATGHYARVVVSGQLSVVSDLSSSYLSLAGRDLRDDERSPEEERGEDQKVEKDYFLASATDAKKDQTYFLYRLRQDQLGHILFPIGDLTKAQVREEAKKRNIPVADKPDSQGICFIGEINVHNFLRERLGENPGDVVNPEGEVIGRHKGLWFYTIGQRHGFEIAASWQSRLGETKHAMPPYYVIKKIPETNQLVVGFGAQTYRDEFVVEDVHWVSGQWTEDSAQKLLTVHCSLSTLYVRIRHGGELLQVDKCELVGDRIRITLAEPIKGLAEGQSAVFYLKGIPDNVQPTTYNQFICLGGGVISG